jgi:POT family proton-dependent oligopeptide transporter
MSASRHPPGLYILFLTEMWERFSFYCMVAVFILYMTWDGNGHPFLQDPWNASLIHGAYFGTVYFTPFFGGLLADWKLGYRYAILLGGLIMGLGHLFLAIDQLVFFFAGLVALTLGNGLFKPNISTLVGKLYPPGDPRLDSAYTIFYMGINIGAFAAPLVAGTLRNHFGFHTAFGAAGIGMVISLLVFLSCQRWLVFERGARVDTSSPREEEVPPHIQRDRNIALVIVFVIVALFWMAFQQGSNTIPRWFRDSTDRTPPAWLPAGWWLDREGLITTEYASSINAGFVILFSLPMAWLWTRLRRAGMEPSTPHKIGLGMLLAAVGFSVLMAAALSGADQRGVLVSPAYLLGAYVFITLAELSLSPIGLSLVARLAPARHRSTWMGGWFVATAVGNYLAGGLGVFWDTWAHSTFFAVLVGLVLTAFVILLVFRQRLQQAMQKPRTVPVEEPARSTSFTPARTLL